MYSGGFGKIRASWGDCWPSPLVGRLGVLSGREGQRKGEENREIGWLEAGDNSRRVAVLLLCVWSAVR